MGKERKVPAKVISRGIIKVNVKKIHIPIPNLGIIIVAGGAGARFGKHNKLFVKLADLPVFMHSVKNFINLCLPENFILVISNSECSTFKKELKRYLPDKNIKTVLGGKTRMHSVYNGLQVLLESRQFNGFVAIHDAARPMASPEQLLNCLDAAKKYGGAVAAKRITDTVKQSSLDGLVTKTIDRASLWTVETPQIFPVNKLKSAYDKAFCDKIEATDDAGIMEHAGYPPFLLEHDEFNIKITYPRDIKTAELFLRH